MKLFENMPHYEGKGFAEAIFGWGKMYTQGEIYRKVDLEESQFYDPYPLPELGATEIGWVENGWYFIFNLPFKINRSYLCPDTCDEMFGPCRWSKIWFKRAPYSSLEEKRWTLSRWLPVVGGKSEATLSSVR